MNCFYGIVDQQRVLSLFIYHTLPFGTFPQDFNIASPQHNACKTLTFAKLGFRSGGMKLCIGNNLFQKLLLKNSLSGIF